MIALHSASMSLRLLPVNLAARRADTAPGTSLGALADALLRELEPLLALVQQGAPLPIPERKARLTRIGGRCPQCARLLEFDPFTPHQHACPVGHGTFEGGEHDDWWMMNAHLWTAERAVHAAALSALRGDAAARVAAECILDGYAARYAGWPNRDNVLGPSRPFFSTYLESIWLLNLCHALDLLEAVATTPVAPRVREQVLAPSAALLASYPEGRSNRQVWNEVAVLSALTMLRRESDVRARLSRRGGLLSLFRDGLLADGTWYEGENYHQFAHRGLWYGVQLLRARGETLPAELDARWHEGFLTPFATLLPDDTFPSRRDSQYAVSARQWRFAEWCELGYAHREDARLANLLSRLYDGRVVRESMARARSSADAERNEPATRLGRDSCSWRALLCANAQPVPEGRASAVRRAASVVQPAQGVALIRREAGQVYVALEGGESAGGHGHPDALALTLQTRNVRWLDDPGTGSYVEPTLHWYRSTLAHHAPLINGASQQRGPTTLQAFEDRGGAGWVRKQSTHLAPGVTTTRTIVVCDGYLVDVLEWESVDDRPVTLTLPLITHPEVIAPEPEADGPRWTSAVRPGAGGLEDGFAFLQEVREHVALAAGTALVADSVASHTAETASPDLTSLRVWYACNVAMTPWRAMAPGAPGHPTQERLHVDCTAPRGRLVGVLSWPQDGGSGRLVRDVQLAPQGIADAPGSEVLASVLTHDGTTATHGPAPHGWHIGLAAGQARSSIDLEGLVAPTVRHHTPVTPAVSQPHLPAIAIPRWTGELPAVNEPLPSAARWSLSEVHYRGTEESWRGANAPSAVVEAVCTATALVLRVHADTRHAVVVDGQDPVRMPHNLLDNERNDVNADGVQVYVRAPHAPPETRAPAERPGWHLAVLAVPLHDGGARVTALVRGGALPNAATVCTDTGWHMQLEWPLASLPAGETLHMDVIVNERPAERERRRGQLILSGGGGFGWLAGDRHDPACGVLVRLPNPDPLS